MIKNILSGIIESNKAVELLNKKSAVIVLDEADRINDQKIIYSLLEDIFRKVLILITNKDDSLFSIEK